MTFSILDHIEKLTPADTKGRYICPVCEGNNFTIDDKTGKYQCWSGCETKSIRDAIAPLPQRRSKPPAKAPRKASERSWVYQDVDGNNLIKVCRKDEEGKGKRIWQMFWDKDLWRKAKDVAQEVKDHAYANVAPLNWAKVKALAVEEGYLFHVEGEKTADALLKVGIPATTFIKNSRNEARFFDGINLVLCPDLDAPGIKTMESIAVQYPTARWAYAYPDSPAWQTPPKDKGVDFADWISEGATDEQILATIGPRRHAAPAAVEAKAKAPEKTSTPKPSKVAAELRSKYAGRLAYNTQSEQWVYYGNTKIGLWDAIPDAELEALVQADLDAMPGFEDGYSMGYVTSVVGLLKGRLNRYSWDEQPGMLPFTNGVYDLATGKLEPHAPGYGFTWQLPRPYVAIASAFPKIDAWLDEATGGKGQLKTILLCWLNAVIKGRSDLQKFLHMVGPGGTGKGTFLRLATTLIGECNAHSSALDVLCQDKFEVANLVGKRLVTFSDEDKYSGRLGIFKQLTGGDLLRAEQKHKSAYPFHYTGVAMVASNYPIFAGDTSSGLHRRVLMVPFTAQCPPEKRRNLEAEFEPELAALTTYLLSLDDDFVTKTLLGVGGQSPEVTELSWEMRMRTDSLAAWLNECVVKKSSVDGYYEEVGSNIDDDTSLFGSYQQWCKRTGSKPVGLREFSPRLLDLCQSVIGWGDVEKRRLTTGDHKGRQIISGLTLRTDTSIEPCPIDALVDAARVKSEGSSEGSVKDRVKAETLDIQGGEECEESDQLYGEKKDLDDLSPPTVADAMVESEGQKTEPLEKSASDPSHPSPPVIATVPAFTAPFTQPSPHPSLVHKRTNEAAHFLRDSGDGFIWIRRPDGSESEVYSDDWAALEVTA